jgi:hypothetical protein
MAVDCHHTVTGTQHLFRGIPFCGLTGGLAGNVRRPAVIDRLPVCSVLLLTLLTPGAVALAQPPAARMTARMAIIVGKDVSGTIYKKLGLPNRQYCWDSCLKDDRCAGVRWGVVDKDTAGMCVLLSGDLAFKNGVALKTEDGKPIHVVAARKEPTSVAP